MTTNTRIAIVAIIIIAIIGFFALMQRSTPVTPEPSNPKMVATTTVPTTEKITYIKSSLDLISVTSPLPGASVSKEFTITGSARGGWYFEGSFPYIVKDVNGNVIAQGPTKGTADWMTTNFVPFTATIKVPATYSGPATIVLEKDNPSGLPENDASISFPITIQ